MELTEKIRDLATQYADRLKQRINERIAEMKEDDQSHTMIYQALGISDKEGKMIDVYQNKGRFLYRYAGSFLEQATKLFSLDSFPASSSVRIENTISARPKKFQIDCLESNNAIEIKWRDATTDGDHITKEHTRIKAISDSGYTPIRVMFYYPNRKQAIRVQKTLETLYAGIGGYYYFGDKAWGYVKARTGFDLKAELESIAREKTLA